MEQTTALLPAHINELMAGQLQLAELTQKLLQANTDYCTLPGIDKPFLLKPGAEKICWAYNCYPEYNILDSEIAHEKVITYTGRDGSEHQSVGLYRYVVECRLIHRPSGRAVGHAIGSASTLENRYINRPRELENTVLKMAQKRALVAAVLNAFQLSDRFTQDEEHGGEVHAQEPPKKEEKPAQSGDAVSEQQLKFIKILVQKLKMEESEYRTMLNERYGVTKASELNRQQASDLITLLNERAAGK